MSTNDPKFYQDMVKDMPVFSQVEFDKETNKVVLVGTRRLEEYAKTHPEDFWFRYSAGSASLMGNSVPFGWGRVLVGFVARNDTEFYTQFLGHVFEKTLKKGEVCLALENMYTIQYVYVSNDTYTEQMYYKGDVDIIFYYNQKLELPFNQTFITQNGVYTYTSTIEKGCVWKYKHTGGFDTNIQEYCPQGSLSYGLLPESVSVE